MFGAQDADKGKGGTDALALLVPNSAGPGGVPDRITRDEDRIVTEHFHYLQRLTEEGVVLLAGRTMNTDPSSFGFVIFEAESEDVKRDLMQDDPAVKASVFRAELFPYRVALAGPGILSP